jgi:PmbA protein
MTSTHNESKLGELHNFVKKGIELGEKLGSTQMEIIIQNGFNRSVELKNNSIQGAQQQSVSGLGVRAYINNKLGIASATLVNKDTVEEVVKTAVRLAKLAPEDLDFNSLPGVSTRKPTLVENLFDIRIAEMDPSMMIETANTMVNGALDKDERANTGGRVTSNYTEFVLANSLGIVADERYTTFSSFASVSIPVASDNVGFGYDFNVSRMLDENYDYFKLGQSGADKAIKLLNPKVAPTGELPVLFDERSTSNSLESIVGDGVDGFAVMSKTSYFSDKIGEKVSIEGLKVWDDPHVKNGMGARAFDAEGVPTTNISLIENGILKSFVTDSYTANKLGVDNTGSAGRGGIAGKPKPSLSQFQVGAGMDSKDAMLADLKEGIYMESAISPMRGAPNISTPIGRGFYVSDGEIQYALKNTMLGSDVFSVLKGITALSKELKVEFGSQSPMMLIDKMTVSGQ